MDVHSRQFRIAHRRAWAALAAASLCSCTALSRPAEQTAAPAVHLGPALADSVASLPPEEAQRVALAAGLMPESDAIRPAGHIADADHERESSTEQTSPQQNVSGQSGWEKTRNSVSPAQHTAPQSMAVHFTPAEPRVALDEGGPQRYPDEYLFDGGDRDIPVHYDRVNRLGLDTEDTVIEYTDDRGGRHMIPSNRVAVYAPRFASVRTLGSSHAHTTIDRAAAAHEHARIIDARHRIGPTRHDHHLAGTNLRVRSRASLYENEQAWSETAQATRVSEHQKLDNIYQNVGFLRTGRLDEADAAWLATRIEAAFAWSRDQQVVITAHIDGVQEVRALLREDTLVGTEERLKDGPLRIVKLADRAVADQGDVVTFTIRYDNLGDRPVHHVRIVDNLTPRLEYVLDSADSDRRGRLVVQDNAEGSLVLIFEVDEPIPPRQGGVVTFQARVR